MLFLALLSFILLTNATVWWVTSYFWRKHSKLNDERWNSYHKALIQEDLNRMEEKHLE